MRRPTLLLLALSAAPLAHAVLMTSGHAMKHCFTPDAAAAAALRDGSRRIGVSVNSFSPPDPAATALVVSLVPPRGGAKREVTRFAVHPLRAFPAGGPVQRFQVSLQEFGDAIKAGEPLCIEVGFATGAGRIAGGEADIEVGVIRLPGS